MVYYTEAAVMNEGLHNENKMSGLLEVNRWRNRKSLLQTLIRERNGSEKKLVFTGQYLSGEQR